MKNERQEGDWRGNLMNESWNQRITEAESFRRFKRSLYMKKLSMTEFLEVQEIEYPDKRVIDILFK